ncbi:hypothetical protein MNEG_15617, partial [Monoraphidium neglectum]
MCGRSRCTLEPAQVAAAAGIPPDQLDARCGAPGCRFVFAWAQAGGRLRRGFGWT